MGFVDVPFVNTRTGEDGTFQLDACSTTYDPDDPTAPISYAWSCAVVATASQCTDITVPPQTSCVWQLGQGTSGGFLKAGVYLFSLAASKSDERTSTSATITVQAGAVPSVAIRALAASKQNAGTLSCGLGAAKVHAEGR